MTETLNIQTVKTVMEQTRDFEVCWWEDETINETINAAVELGWVQRNSTTQVEWTEKGIEVLIEDQPVKTQTIAGHSITLENGKRYQASRDILSRRPIETQKYTIKIIELAEGDCLDFANSILGRRATVLEIPNLTNDQANIFLTEFNNEPLSLSGRIW